MTERKYVIIRFTNTDYRIATIFKEGTKFYTLDSKNPPRMYRFYGLKIPKDMAILITPNLGNAETIIQKIHEFSKIRAREEMDAISKYFKSIDDLIQEYKK